MREEDPTGLSRLGAKDAASRQTLIRPSNPAGKLNAGFRQVTEEFPHQEHVGSLQLVIVAELELVGFGYDQSLVGLAENALLLQAIGAPPDGFDRQTEKAGQGGTGNALLDPIRLNRLDAAKLPVQFGVLHDLENVGVQDRMNDHQVQRIEIVVAEHFAGCAQHVGQRVAGDGSDQIRRDVLAFSRTNHGQCPLLRMSGSTPTSRFYVSVAHRA
ncbi:hypothetical protein IVB33_11675 [Bradyrhizobium sp. 24]|nr:hypothetical protein [Bradyrhizobium sp. 24]